MHTGLSSLNINSMIYLKLVIMYQETSRWNFLKRSVIKDEIDFYYPLMKAENKNIKKIIATTSENRMERYKLIT